MVAYIAKTASGSRYVVFQSEGAGVDGLLTPGKWYAMPCGDDDKPLTGDKSPAVDSPQSFDAAGDAERFVVSLA